MNYFGNFFQSGGLCLKHHTNCLSLPIYFSVDQTSRRAIFFSRFIITAIIRQEASISGGMLTIRILEILITMKVERSITSFVFNGPIELTFASSSDHVHTSTVVNSFFSLHMLFVAKFVAGVFLQFF